MFTNADPAATPTDTPEAMARVLALFVLSDAQVHPAEINMLGALGAFQRLGVSRTRFNDLVLRLRRELDEQGLTGSWHNGPDALMVDRALSAVQNPAKRLLVARFAAAVMTADGRVEGYERQIYQLMLLRWKLTQADVTQAILDDRTPVEGSLGRLSLA
jgi:hypothetical protein